MQDRKAGRPAVLISYVVIICPCLGISFSASAEDLKAIAEKLEVINLQLSKRKLSKWKSLYWLFVSSAAIIVLIFALLAVLQSPYLNWNFNDPETAIAGTLFHAFEYLFVRVAPIAFIGTTVGSIIVRRKYLSHL